MIWDFIQDQLLGMRWLSELIGRLLAAVGLDTASRIGGSVQFFLYDVLKITVLLCVLIFLISYLQSYFPPERSKRILGRFHGVGANCAAALLGTVTPFCSCSSIPLFIGFTSAGLPLGVTFSFLISSPMVDLGSLVLDFIRSAKAADSNAPTLTQKDRLQYAKAQVVSTFRKVFPYILLGVAVGAIIHNWIPERWIEAVLGTSNPLGVVLATVIGVPMYADIFGTIPVAEALLAKGAQLGTILSFMMAVTTLSLPSLILLRKAVKPRLLGVFVAICTAGIILVGYLFNAIQFLLI